MSAAMWSTNGGRLNSYRASIGRYVWVLTLKAVGWVMESSTPSIGDVFVAPVTTDAETAFAKATYKARNVA